MRRTIVMPLMLSFMMLSPIPAAAHERLLHGLLGAGAGALVGGRGGAVAGGLIGFFAGPAIADALGAPRRHYYHRRHAWHHHHHYRYSYHYSRRHEYGR